MRGRFLAFLIFPILLFAIYSNTVQAATFNVNNAASLIAAINTANSNNADDTINLTANITLTTVNNNTDGPTGLPIILPDNDHDLIIEGNGFTIRRDDAAPEFRIFYVAELAYLRLNNLTVSNGALTSSNGAGIVNEGNVYLFNTTVSDNNINGGYGAGILNLKALRLYQSAVTNNTITGTYGGGAGIYNQVTALISNSLISDNMINVFGGNGAGIFSDGSDSLLLFWSSTLSANHAINGQGGAIGGFGDPSISGANIELDGSTVSGNSSLFFGNGIYNVGGTVSVENSTLSGNYEATRTLSGGGGAIAVAGATLNIDYSTITNNEIGILAEESTVNVSNSIISGNIDGNNSNPYDCGLVEPATIFNANDYNLFGTNANNGGCIPGTRDIVATGGINTILNPLADNGGDIETHALISGSPAINAAHPSTCLSDDQRGESRPIGGRCDISAYEADGSETSILQAGPIFTVNITADEDNGTCTLAHCSLREAINAANSYSASPPMVSIPAGTYQVDAILPALTRDDLSIIGAGIDATIIEADGNNIFSIIPANYSSDLFIESMTINNPQTVFDVGGYVFLGARNLAITGTISGQIYTDGTGFGESNHAIFSLIQIDDIIATSSLPLFEFHDTRFLLYESAITNSQIPILMSQKNGIASFQNVTISGNTFGNETPNTAAIMIDGDILPSFTTSFDVTISTIANNSNFDFEVSGVGDVDLFYVYSIFSGSTIQGTASDCSLNNVGSGTTSLTVAFTIIENNDCALSDTSQSVLSVDPLLLPLADNSASTLTHALDENSPALNMFDDVDCLGSEIVLDQRGVERPQGDGCDIGAYESELIVQPEVTPTPEVTPEITPEVTPSETSTSEVTPEITPEVTPSETSTPEVTPEITPEVTPSETSTPEVTPEITPEVTPSETSTPEVTPEITPEVTPSETSTSEVTPEITPEVTPSETSTPEVTPEITPEVTPSETSTPEVTLEITPEVTPSETSTPEVTLEITPEVTPSETSTPEVTPEITPEVTPSETSTPEVTPEITPEVTPSETSTPEVTPEITPSETSTPEVTPEITPEVTMTVTPEITDEPSVTEEWRDADGDNIPDDVDTCPWQGNEGGLDVDETGCPYYDADWDGFADRDDACPWQGDEGGLGVDETGCPYYDADGDQIIDRDDTCPWRANEYGLGIDATGCPIESTSDPYSTDEPQPSYTEEWSYPDYDGDGFSNLNDACPWQGNEGGLGVDETGCPYYDADWDGVLDSNDACPWRGNEYGLGIDAIGCPINPEFGNDPYVTEDPNVTEEPR